jgi:hypothetical protein
VPYDRIVGDEPRRALQRLVPLAEEEARRRGMSEAEIVEKRRELEQLGPMTPEQARVVEAELAAARAGRPPDRLPPLGPSGLMWVAERPRLFAALAVVLSAVLGYFGLLRGRSGEPLPSGTTGLLVGAGIAVGACVFAYVAVARRRSR